MWKEIVSLFRSEGALQEAYDESILMLVASRSMFDDSVAALHAEGTMETDIYGRDRRINRYERSVRRKIVTHMSVSSKPDINLGLVLTAIVIDIERIGDYTKNIVELASAVEGPFDGLELHDEVLSIEGMLGKMFSDIVPALEESDETRARAIISSHGVIAEKVDKLRACGHRSAVPALPEARECPYQECCDQRGEPLLPLRFPGEGSGPVA